MEEDPLLRAIVERVSRVKGIQAVVLGGSRARATHAASSDYDIGLYYDPAHPPDLDALDAIAAGQAETAFAIHCSTFTQEAPPVHPIFTTVRYATFSKQETAARHHQENITEDYTMKKLFLIAVLVAIMAASFATSAFAAGPGDPGAQAGNGLGYGAARGVPAPGTGTGQAAPQGFAARRGAPEWTGDNEAAAGILGLTVEELQAERLAGKSLATIAQEKKGLSEEALIAELIKTREANVAQLKAEGKITETQAEYMRSNMAEHVKTMVERTNVGPASFRGQSPMTGTHSQLGGGRWNR